MRKMLIVVIIVALGIGAGFFYIHTRRKDRTASAAGTTKTVQQQSSTTSTNTDTPKTSFNKQANSIDEAKSIWVVVNKQRPLEPQDYVPDSLVVPDIPLKGSKNDPNMHIRADTATALEALAAAAKQEAGYSYMLASGYRSYTYQNNLYNMYVKRDGQASADSLSAQPGHSEHQTGLAADVATTSYKCVVEECFGDMPEGKWLAANAYRFGFIIRYPKDARQITGYAYEPWHLRYVGATLASEIHRQNTTLEQFFSLPDAGTYSDR